MTALGSAPQSLPTERAHHLMTLARECHQVGARQAVLCLAQCRAQSEQLVDLVSAVADEKIRPHVKEMDEKGVFEKDLIHDFFQLGLMGIEIPEQYGGSGGKFFEAILAVEECSRVDASSGVIVDVQNTLVNNALLRWGNEEQKKRYLPRMATEIVGAYALSEAGSGSDAFALQTRATLKGSEYVLNGRKLWITNGKEAGLFVLFATLDPSVGYKGI